MPALSGGMKRPGDRYDGKPASLRPITLGQQESPVAETYREPLRQTYSDQLFCKQVYQLKLISSTDSSQQTYPTQLSTSGSTSLKNQHSTGLITGPSMISYLDQLSLPDYDDVADCVAIARASADTVANRFSDASKWLEEYALTLDYLGWELYNNEIATRTRTLLSGSIADFLPRSVDGMDDQHQANAMIDTLDSLKPNTMALSFFDNETRLGDHFQVMPTRYDSKGSLWLAIYDLEFVTTMKSASFLFFESKNPTATITQQRAFFKRNKKRIDDNRKNIEEKLRHIALKRFDLKNNP